MAADIRRTWNPASSATPIGRWEGDTLVVETIGIKTITELVGRHEAQPEAEDHRALPAWIRQDPNRLVLDMTIEDADALEKPWKRQFSFARQRDWSLMEFICAENDRNPVNADGHTQFQ